MPRFTLNTSEALKFSPLEDGEYPVEVVEFSEVRHGDKSMYVTATLEVSEGEFAGKRLWMNLPLNGKGAGITRRFLDAVAPGAYPEGDEIEFDTDDLVGSQARVVVTKVESRIRPGEMTNEIRAIYPR